MDNFALITQVAETNRALFTKVLEFALAERQRLMDENHADLATRYKGSKWTFQVVTAQK
jgi:hypothetical protein